MVSRDQLGSWQTECERTLVFDLQLSALVCLELGQVCLLRLAGRQESNGLWTLMHCRARSGFPMLAQVRTQR